MLAAAQRILQFLRGKTAMDCVHERLSEMNQRLVMLEAEQRIRHVGRVKLLMGGLSEDRMADVRPLFRD